MKKTDDYYKFCYFMMMTGIACGLNHPIEWAVNAHRTPGGILGEEYYRKCEEYLPKFLVDVYDSIFLRPPESADDVLKMCDDHYKNNQFCIGYFEFLRDRIDSEIRKEE